jgi:hypothetical protein
MKKFEYVKDILIYKKESLKEKMLIAPIGEMTKKYYRQYIKEINEALRLLK